MTRRVASITIRARSNKTKNILYLTKIFVLDCKTDQNYQNLVTFPSAKSASDFDRKQLTTVCYTIIVSDHFRIEYINVDLIMHKIHSF